MQTQICKFSLLLAVFLFVMGLQAQPFVDVEIKVNTTYTSETINGVAQIIVDYPQNGDYSFTNVSDGFLLNYEPDSGFLGHDTLIVEYMDISGGGISYEVFFFEVKPTLIYLENDYYTVDKNDDYKSYNALDNDHGTDEPFYNDQILQTTNGFSYLSNDSLYFKPNSNFEGIATLTYRACDSMDYCDKAQIKFIVVDPDNIASEDSLVLYTPENTSIRFILPDTAFENTSGPDLGVVENEYLGSVFQYIPFQNENGTDEITMNNGNLSRTIIIHIIDVPTPNQRVVDDYVYTHKNSSIEFNVLENDFISTGRVNSFTSPSHGDVVKLSDGEFKFTPDTDFEGLTEFSYTTCIFGANCETGRVKIFVGNLNPDNRSNYNLITPKNRDLVINYDVPIANFMFEIAQDCSYGELEIYPGLDTLNIGCEEVIGHNLVTYSPDSNFVGEDEFDLEYCVNNGADCEIVKVKVDVIDQDLDSVCICADDCVWPGDIDHDGKVDMIDLLSLGWHIGIGGEERPYAQPEEWFGQYAPNWEDQQINRNNLKHADVNGDGFVGVDDTIGIDNFYQNVHTILNDPIKEPRVYPIMLEIDSPQDPEPGDYVLLNVLAGTENDPAYDLHGLQLNFDFHPDIVDTSTIEMFFSPSSWLVANDANLNLVKHSGRSIDGAISRIDSRGRAGFGLVAQIGFVIEDDLDGIRALGNNVTFDVGTSETTVMLGDGSLLNLSNVSIPLQIKMYSEQEKSLNRDDLLVYPNPTTDLVNVRSNGGSFDAYELINMHGLVVSERNMSNPVNYSQLQLSGLHSGLYVLRVKSKNGSWVSKKIQIVE
jgi:hypothetical protein